MSLTLSFNKKKAVWVDYELFDENGNVAGNAQFYIKPIETHRMNAIIKEATVREKKVIIENGRKRKDIVENIDSVKFLELLFDEVCLDWKGLQDDEGNEIPCNRETKKNIVNFYPDIANFCIEEAREIKIADNNKKEELEKN